MHDEKTEVAIEKNEDVETQIEEELPQDTEKEINVPKEKKHQKALRLVAEAKAKLHAGGFDVCISLLEQLGYQYTDKNQTFERKVVVFEPKEELAPLVLKNVSSGKFTGFMLALAMGVVTAVGLTYLATEKLGMTLDISKVPTPDSMQTIASWFSTAVGLAPNASIGAGVFALATLSTMAVVYATRVSLKGSKNLHFAVKQFVEAEVYTEHKADCKAEMDKVDAHMKETVHTLKLYEVLFNEQKGKLERILHIEGSKSKSTDYHEKSYAEIRETKALVRAIDAFVQLPMSKEGRLSEESIDALKVAKTQADKMLDRLY